jgi:hypothetical protein
MTRGIVMHAYNNEQVDYALIAMLNALMIKKNMNVPVALITFSTAQKYLEETQGKELVKKAFDYIIVNDKYSRDSTASKRRFNDTVYTKYMLPWFNKSRSDTYDLTPFDETILIDSDYMIMDKTLNLLWGSSNDIMISRDAIPLNHGELKSSEKWLEDTSVRLYWATCVYFKKSKNAEMLFNLVRHIKENYEYYSLVYGFPTQLFRNDYAFSIAIHMLNGFIPNNEEISSLPFPLLTSFDCDDFIDMPTINEMTFLMNDRQETWKYNLSKIKKTNVHVMNKFSIVRQSEKIKELYAR